MLKQNEHTWKPISKDNEDTYGACISKDNEKTCEACIPKDNRHTWGMHIKE